MSIGKHGRGGSFILDRLCCGQVKEPLEALQGKLFDFSGELDATWLKANFSGPRLNFSTVAAEIERTREDERLSVRASQLLHEGLKGYCRLVPEAPIDEQLS